MQTDEPLIIEGLENVLVLAFDPSVISREELMYMSDEEAFTTCQNLSRAGNATIMNLGTFQTILNNDDMSYAGKRYRFISAIKEYQSKSI